VACPNAAHKTYCKVACSTQPVDSNNNEIINKGIQTVPKDAYLTTSTATTVASNWSVNQSCHGYSMSVFLITGLYWAVFLQFVKKTKSPAVTKRADCTGCQ